jgi:integrase
MEPKVVAHRNRKVTGRLYKRDGNGHEYPAGSDANAVYWLQYTRKGQRIRQKLIDPATGVPITELPDAEAERDRILAPFSTKSEVAQLKAVAARLSDAEERHAAAEKRITPALRLADAWDAYKASTTRPGSGDATLVNYQRHLRQFTDWLRTARPDVQQINQVTSAIASDYAGTLDRNGVSPNTYNKHIGFMSLFYRVMIEDSRAEHNPFAKVRRRKLRTNSRKELSRELVRELLSTAEGELGMLLGLGYYTGLRRGDCCTLQWAEVDLDRDIIRRMPNKTRERTSNPEPVKVGIPPELHAALARTPTERRRGYVLPGMAKLYNGSKRDRIVRMVTAHFLKCGIQCQREGTGEDTGKRAVVDYGFHSLRYSYISHHAELGTPLAVIQANAGHRSPSMTEHYTRISDETARRTAALLTLPAANGGTPSEAETEPEPLPQWARDLAAKLTSGNWEAIRAQLLGGG